MCCSKPHLLGSGIVAKDSETIIMSTSLFLCLLRRERENEIVYTLNRFVEEKLDFVVVGGYAIRGVR